MSSLRHLFLLRPEVVFLNHGSFGATPLPVFESYQRWQLELERQPVEFLQRRLPELMVSVRADLAKFLGTTPETLLLTTNVTMGLNIIAHSLKLGEGDEVLTTDHEYGSMNTMWQYLAQQRGFRYINREIPLPIRDTVHFVDSFWEGVTPRTRVIYISHITSPTAIIFPVKEVIRRARQAGILTVIDGAHTPGQIPLALDDLGADFYSGNLHKWLCTPKGSAFLYARPEVQHLLEPLIITGGWRMDRPPEVSTMNMLDYIGTRDPAAFLAIPDAIRFFNENNWTEVQARCHGYAAETRRRITALSGHPAYCPDSPEWYAQMATAILPDRVEPGKLWTFLHERYNIEVPIGEWKGRKQTRFSYQGYNSQADVDTFIEGIEAYLRSA